MKFAALLALFISPLALAAETEVKEFDAKTIHSFDIENLNGNIKIEGGHEEKIVITAEKTDFTKSCRLEIKQKGADLDVKVSRKGVFKKSDCTTHFTVLLPKVIELELKSGSGNIAITGTKGDIDFKIGNGQVTIDADVHELDGSAGNADINVKSLTGKTELKMGSGTVKAAYAALPATGEFEIKSGSGNVELTLPADAKIQTSFISVGGKMTNEVGDTPNAGFKVKLKSGAANLHIKKAL
ncbi:DUF4097 family beta strand repeat-containing protein [Bdellovibrio bacteriovorus]|nr:DUF4097 family beta strand repeat-containing protein [Bdellovibrio bacteriovorus]